MIIELSDEALDFGRVVSQAIESAGGDQLVQIAEETPARRAEIATVLGELGAWDLQLRTDADELEAAAALCRSAGYWTVPYPVAERLARTVDVDVEGLLVVADVNPSAAIQGLDDLRWVAVTLAGNRSRATARPTNRSPRMSAFVTELDLTPIDGGNDATDVALGLTLPCWTLLGMLDRAIDLTRRHVVEREQFGQPLAGFQSVQFQLADAEVERSGVEMLAKYALWSIHAGRSEAIADALALRMATIEAAEIVFRAAHQLHGATGFCDETTLSWVSRYSQPLRRLPFGLSATRGHLANHVGRHGLTGLFGAPREHDDTRRA